MFGIRERANLAEQFQQDRDLQEYLLYLEQQCAVDQLSHRIGQVHVRLHQDRLLGHDLALKWRSQEHELVQRSVRCDEGIQVQDLYLHWHLELIPAHLPL